MNLNDITTKPYILALIIRDDGERLLLGDGTYDFKDTLQHFQADTFANDVVELQGADGQLLAGQVRRAGTQKFAGYIGDSSMSKQKIEELRRAFLMFFRKKHFYKVVYIFCDGSAIQRKRGYIVNPPTAPEMWQKFPEYSISLNFEDVNYYEYEEDELGDEIYAHIVQIALAKALEGGLVWDAIGAVTNDITWSNILSASGEYISINNALDRMAPLASVQIDGNATQDGTPTPDSPVDIQVVTGENVVKITGKNLFDYESARDTNNTFVASYRVFEIDGLQPSTTYTLSNLKFTSATAGKYVYFWGIPSYPGTPGVWITTPSAYRNTVQYNSTSDGKIYLAIYPSDENTWNELIPFFEEAQLELGSTATDYEPYQAQSYEVNLGKNLLDPSATLQGTWNVASNTTTCTFFTPIYNGETYTISNQDTATWRFSAGLTTSPTNNPAGTGSQISAWQTGASYTITAQSNGYLWVQLRKNANTAITPSDIPTDVFMIERGSTATDFVEYFTPIELAKIGTYQDYIWKDGDDWKVHKEVGKVVLDGSETWGLYSTTSLRYSFGVNIADKGWSSISYVGIMCDQFTPDASSENDQSKKDQFTCRGTTYNNRMWFFNPTDRFAGSTTAELVAEWKTLLASSPITLYYMLAESVDEEITNEALISQLDAIDDAKLYVGQNNIGTTTLNATPTLELEYYGAYTEEGSGYEWEPGGGSQNIITVDGIDNARPIWQVIGPANNPTLTNITTGQTISWQGFVPIGQTLTIDMNEMTADLAGANVFEYITGTWIELRPGNNTLVYTADGGAEADSTLSWNGVAS